MKESIFSSELAVAAVSMDVIGSLDNRNPPIPQITGEMFARAGGNISRCPCRCLGLGYQVDKVLPHRVDDMPRF